MAIWMGNVRLPEAGFRLVDPSSGSSFAMKPLGEDWEVIPEQLFDSEGKPLLAGPVRVSPRIGFKQDWKDAFLRLTTLPGAQARGETMTGSSDLLLELRAYNSLGKPVFQIGADRIVALDQGLELQVFGPRFTPGSSQTPR